MTLNDLIRKANAIGRQFNSGEIPLVHGDEEVSFGLEISPPRSITNGWKVKITNYREEKK